MWISNSTLVNPLGRNAQLKILSWKGWDDWTCNIPPTQLVSCACEKQGSVYLKLRGRCPESVIDTYWTVQTEMGQYFLHGIDTSVIRYDYTNNIWTLNAAGKDQFASGSSGSPYHSFLLGKSKWFLKNDQSNTSILLS